MADRQQSRFSSNRRAHVLKNNAELLDAGERREVEHRDAMPAARSLDMNVLDLGLFNALQSVQYQTDSHTTVALIDAVKRVFERIQADTIDKTFLTLQKVREKVIENEGGNNFQLPRIKKIPFSRGAPTSSLPIASELVCKEFSFLERMANLNLE